jgi:ABC-type transporter Mla subunit MlaD
MKGNQKENGVLYITHSGELLFWLIILLIIISISTMCYIHKERTSDNDYRVFLQDVDGLIVGSPVRMMGIEVGHVTKIKPVKDEVYVKFILTNPDVYIPQGTEVTVEFSGMAGSKSLELYLPQNTDTVDEGTPLMTVLPPKRLHDAMGLLNDMFKKLSSIIYTTSSFGSKLNIETTSNKNNNGGQNIKLNEVLTQTNKILDDSNIKVNELKLNMERARNDK